MFVSNETVPLEYGTRTKGTPHLFLNLFRKTKYWSNWKRTLFYCSCKGLMYSSLWWLWWDSWTFPRRQWSIRRCKWTSSPGKMDVFYPSDLSKTWRWQAMEKTHFARWSHSLCLSRKLRTFPGTYESQHWSITPFVVTVIDNDISTYRFWVEHRWCRWALY